MSLSKLIVLTRPVEGREQDYNDWYDGQHLDDVLAVPGIVSAQRFDIQGEAVSGEAWPYLAIYEIDHDDPQVAIEAMVARAGTDAMPLSDAMDQHIYCVMYKARTPRRAASAD